MSTGVVLGIVGGAIGSVFGPGGAQIGFLIGSTVGGIIDPPHFDGPKLADSPVQTARDGVPIPIGWGLWDTFGNIIQKNEEVRTTRKVRQGKGGPTTEETRITRTFAIGIGRGPTGEIAGLRRVWENGKLIFDGRAAPTLPAADSQAFLDKTTLYLGTETQNPDPELETETGVGTTPSYRGLAYIVFNNYDLTDFLGAIPTYHFEIDPGQCTAQAGIVHLLSTTNIGFDYVEVDYSSGATILGTLALTGGLSGESGFATDGIHVALVNVTTNDIYVYKWNGTNFVETTHTDDVDSNALEGLFGGDGFWMSAGSGDFGAGVSTGVWSSSSVGSAATSRWSPFDIPAKGIMDFRSESGGIEDYEGYGDTYVASIASPHGTSDHMAQFDVSVPPSSPPSVGNTIIIGPSIPSGTAHSDSTGHDRKTGDIALVFTGGVHHIRWWQFDVSAKSFTLKGDIQIGEAITLASFYHGFLLVISGGDAVLKSYSLNGVNKTLVDSIDLDTWLDTNDMPEYIHTDPFSDHLLLGKYTKGGVGIEMFANGTFNTTAVSLTPPDIHWTQVTNGVYFLDSALTVTP